jgi:hypothetical protein
MKSLQQQPASVWELTAPKSQVSFTDFVMTASSNVDNAVRAISSKNKAEHGTLRSSIATNDET